MKTSKRVVGLTALVTLLVIAFSSVAFFLYEKNNDKVVRVVYIYEGDASTPYTGNFMKAQQAVEQTYGNRVESIAFYNVKDANIDTIYKDVIASNCDIVFSTSYGFEKTIKQWAKEHPEIEFCQATGDNANQDEKLPNYHNFMGTIYQGRYVAGVAAGAKIKEMIHNNLLTEEQVKIGYVAAFPYAEVISGYTAFYIGVQSQIPTATMEVAYVNSWSDYSKEKAMTKRLIDDGCVIISQHSDTIGPAVACQEMSEKKPVIHVGYNGSMIDVAPTTTLISSKINWAPYEIQAVGAVLKGRKIEKEVQGETKGNDAWAGFDEGWVEILGFNEFIAAKGTQDLINKTIKDLKSGKINVFSGPFTGTNPYDPSDTIDLSKKPFDENGSASAPQFCYILDEVIKVIE